MPESRLRRDEYGNAYVAELFSGETVIVQAPPSHLSSSFPFRPVCQVCQWCKGTLGADSHGQCGGCGAPLMRTHAPAPQPSPIWA